MEIKILCNCGTKYQLEFEPVDGRVPWPVICPACGIDATEFANAHVQQSSGIAVAATAPEPAIAAAAAPVAPVKPVLRMRVPEPAPAPAPAPMRITASAAAPAVAPSPAPKRKKKKRRKAPTRKPSPYNSPDEGLSPQFFLGLGGALLGVVVGCALWYLIFHLTDKNYRITAWVVGIAGGFGAKLLSKDEGSTQLGLITTTFVLLGVVFTAYSIGRDRVHGYIGGFEAELYEMERDYAKRAVAAVPNGTDEEIRLFLAEEDAWEDEEPELDSVPESEIRLFREVRMAHYKELAAGKIKKDDFMKSWMRLQFDEQVADARHILDTLPNESDAEIRAHLAQEYVPYGATADPASITASDIAEFRAEELPELKALAGGEKQFEDNPEDYMTAEQALDEFEKSEEGGWMKFIYFFAGWGIGGIGIMFLTLGTAYKICTHA